MGSTSRTLPKFFKQCAFKEGRYTFDLLAAQMVCIEMEGGPTNVRDSDLNKMYKDNKNFNRNGIIAKKINQALKYLFKAFPNKTPELERYNVITLYCLVRTLIENFVHKNTEPKLAEWFKEFEKKRDENEKIDDDEKKDPLLTEYKLQTSRSTDSKDSIQSRHDYISGCFFRDFPDIQTIDKQRSFTHEQRLAIYRKDEGRCQIKLKCNGTEKLGWNNWHADHKIPHSQGGETTVSNGQVACSDCNLAKGGNT